MIKEKNKILNDKKLKLLINKQIKEIIRNNEREKEMNHRIGVIRWFIYGFENWLKYNKISNKKGLKLLKEYLSKEVNNKKYLNYKYNGRFK